jgi:hypothetical protein
MKMPPEADGTVGLDEKAAEGGYPSVAPIGYQNVDDDRITLHLNKDTVCDTILRNPAYYGTFRWGGKTYDGNYPPTRPGSVRYARTQRKGRTPQNPRVELHGHGRKSHRDTTFALRPPRPRREKQGLVELNGIEPSTS